MKRLVTTTLLLTLFVFALTSTTLIHSVAAHDAHSGGNECGNPSQQVMIHTHDSELLFDKTEITVEKGACVMFMFENTQDQPHDFTIVRANGSEWAHLHLDNNLDNATGPSPGLKIIHLEMPNEDITFSFKCTVTGHEAAGMKGKLIVGEGSPESDDGFLPGFGFFSAFAGLVGLMVLSIVIKRKN